MSTSITEAILQALTAAGHPELAGDVLAGLPPVSQLSDGHHTYAEMYGYRALYNAHAARGWLAEGIEVVRSFKHHDGEDCFGGGWFVVVVQLPSGQVSNHYPSSDWDLFATVPEVERAPVWDGHDPAVAAERLREELRRNHA